MTRTVSPTHTQRLERGGLQRVEHHAIDRHGGAGAKDSVHVETQHLRAEHVRGGGEVDCAGDQQRAGTEDGEDVGVVCFCPPQVHRDVRRVPTEDKFHQLGPGYVKGQHAEGHVGEEREGAQAGHGAEHLQYGQQGRSKVRKSTGQSQVEGVGGRAQKPGSDGIGSGPHACQLGKQMQTHLRREGFNPTTKKLEIVTTANQDPLISHTPIIGVDIWEHRLLTAFYLQYKNVKPDYLNAIWNVDTLEVALSAEHNTKTTSNAGGAGASI
ncbi:manganese superoxide dismutase 2 [Heterobasidion irregulare TC 32-1]|uniref:superoxide dismutase n=1 Tax=Heterobasidion irregulare (strain TC 32-1) TaxID=747525 RepID=W4K439_HETIT|nr:manganese superoxide dismutase 2 [Heterobasidion irregulare TC 32-1]ETW80110.1 manganese superoxide dismutase 2 [Heterobasidion irregulare TC 32-1]